MPRALVDQVYDLCFEGVKATSAAFYCVGRAGLGADPNDVEDNGENLTEREKQLVELGAMAGASAALAAVADPVNGAEAVLGAADRATEELIDKRRYVWQHEEKRKEGDAVARY
jgi:hypothetical protein